MSRRGVLWLIALIALCIGLGLVGGALGPGARPRFPSSHAAAPEGLLAFRRLIERLGIPTELSADPWDRLAEQEAGGLLVVATPLQRHPTPAETEALRGWIERGGGLLVIDDATELERARTLDGMLAGLGLGAVAPLTDVDSRRLGVARPPTARAIGSPARPSDPDLPPVELNLAALEVDAWAVPLAVRSGGEVVVGAIAHGQGKAVRVLGALLANDRIAEGGNLELALRLVEDLRGAGTVTFDEYHHGYGGIFGVGRLDRRALLWAAAQALVVAVLFGLARGVRFGPPRFVAPPSRRSSLEFVHSMASLYRRADSRRHIVSEARARFVREARARWGLAEELEGRRLSEAVAGLGGFDGGRVTRTFERADEAIAAMQINEATMVRCVRDLAQLEREAFGEPEANP